MNRWQPLGSTGLQCHPLGFGCYRVMNGNSGHEAALRSYLARGGNLIDTSANYGDGASEELAGKVLAGVPRDRVIVVTKGGYIQGQNMTLAQQRRFPEVVEYGPGIWHCIHPEFLATQIERSLARMKLDHADVYLLHNPEYYLEEITHRRGLEPADHEEFYRHIREAFRYLEGQVAAGAIRWYGVSSNNFGKAAFAPNRPTTMTSVERCLAEAESVSRDHHFRVVQLPLNLYEPGGALEPNNQGKSVLEFCRERGLGVLANRPLNAFDGQQLIRLADWTEPGAPAPGPEALDAMLQPLAELEEKFAQAIGEPFRLAGGEAPTELLLRVVPQMQSLSHWQQAAGRHVIEPIQAWLTQARERFQERPGWQPWIQEFVAVINPLLQDLQRHVAARQQRVSDEIRARLLAAGYPANGETLSQMSLRVLAALEGLSCVLVGMRRPRYVEDAMAIENREALDGVAILRRFNSPSTSFS